MGEARQTDITLISVYLSAYEKIIIILQRELVPERGRRKVMMKMMNEKKKKKTILFISPLSTQPIKTNEETKNPNVWVDANATAHTTEHTCDAIQFSILSFHTIYVLSNNHVI